MGRRPLREESKKDGWKEEGKPEVGVEDAALPRADWLPRPALSKRFIRVGAAGRPAGSPHRPRAEPGSERPTWPRAGCLWSWQICSGKSEKEVSGRVSGWSAMRRASRDYTKYLRGSEEMGSGGSGSPHEGPLHAPLPPAPPVPQQPAATSRFMFVALLGLGLGQVVCSVALFLYFRAQVSAGLSRDARVGHSHLTFFSPTSGKLSLASRLGCPDLAYSGEKSDSKEGASARDSLVRVLMRWPWVFAQASQRSEAGLSRYLVFEFPPARQHWPLTSSGDCILSPHPFLSAS